MLFPKKVKFRKWQSDRKNPAKLSLPDTRGITLAFGSFGLKAQTQGRVRSNQIEAARKVLARAVAKGGKVWVRIFPDRPYTQKGAELPMGKGKGDVQGYLFDVRPGRMLLEIDGVVAAEAKDALRKAGTKLPLKSRIVSREH